MGEQANITLNIEEIGGKSVAAGLDQIAAAEGRLEAKVRVGNRTLAGRIDNEQGLVDLLAKVKAAEEKAATAGQARAAASLQAQRSSGLYQQFLKKEREAEQAANEEKKRAASLAKQKSDALLKEMTAEQNAAKAADKKAAADRAAAQASLARQKSAAVLADLLEKEAEAEKRQRLNEFGKATMARALNDADEATFKRTQKRLADMAQGQAGAGINALSLAKRLGVLGAATTAVGIAFDELSDAQDRAMAKALRSDALASGMKDLVMALPDGAEGDAALRKITKIGAENGMAPDATAALAAPLYATADKNADGKLDEKEQASFDKNLGAGAMLGSAGVKSDDAANVILAGDNKGVGGEDTAAKLLKAAAISKRGPAEFSRSASAISQFGDLDTGMAVTTALSAAELNPERLAERTKDVQLSLSSGADDSKFSKKFGLAGLSEDEKIAKLRKDAAASGDVKKFTDQFQGIEGFDEGKALSMAMLVQQGDLYGNAKTALGDTGAKDLAPAIQKLKNNPLTGSQMRSAEASAASANADLFGTGSDAAREERAAALARGAELRRYGGDRAVNEDGTEKTFSFNPLNILGAQNRDIIGGRWDAMWNGMPGTGLNKGGINQDTKTTGFEKLEKQLELLNSTLEKNTAATVANSESAKGGGVKPVGGAAANAEEKY